MRGDRPHTLRLNLWASAFTPHARGSTFHFFHKNEKSCVYPACAGIDPPAVERLVLHGSLPRMRGDRPFKWCAVSGNHRFTPHARGSTPR